MRGKFALGRPHPNPLPKGEGKNTIFFCYDAHLDPASLELLRTLKPAVVVLLRNPYDEVFVDENTVCIKAFGFRAVQIEACVSLFKNSESLT